MRRGSIRKRYHSKQSLLDTGLEQEVIAAFNTDARIEESIQRVALPAEAVDDIRTRLDQRCLAHIGQERQHGVRREFSLTSGDVAVLDASK